MSRSGGYLLTSIVSLLVLNLYQNATRSCTIRVSLLEPGEHPPPPPHVILPEHPLRNVLSGYFPGWNNGTTLDRSALDKSSQSIVPDRIIAVFGLESSGASFVQRAIADAIGATQQSGTERVTANNEVRVQHLSLPFGSSTVENDPNFDKRFEPLPIVPVFVPRQCRLDPRDMGRQLPAPPECHTLFGPELVPSVARYFVNVTSHIQFYRQRGVEATAVLVLRDPALHFKGIIKERCPNETAAFEQFKTGRLLLQQAMERLDPSTVVVVSYETLMTLRDVYLREIYKSLGIRSNHSPDYANGNIKYIANNVIPTSIATKLQEDNGVIKYVKPTTNMYEPASMAEIRAQRQKNNVEQATSR